MIADNFNLKILIIEDNQGDYLLIKEYIEENFKPEILHASTFNEGQAFLANEQYIDIVLLDLSLPDHQGEKLIYDVASLSNSTPIIVLTGNSEKEFALQAISLGVSDYLLKDEISGSLIQKSILYSLERNKLLNETKQNEEKYKSLFHLSPQPMWVYDLESLMFLDVNEAATRHYGYSSEEFLEKSLRDIRPKEDIEALEKAVALSKNKEKYFFEGHFRHVKKNGELIYVQVNSNIITYEGKKAEIVLITDVTEKLKSEEALKLSESRFKALIQEGADLITVIDENGIVTYQSPSNSSSLSLDPKRLEGKNIYKLVKKNTSPEDLKYIDQALKDIFHLKQVSPEPYRMKWVDGKWHWFQTILTNLLDEPSVNGIVINSRDITENYEKEHLLKISNERYEIVSKATSDTIWDWNLENDDFFWNKGIKVIYGYDDNQIEHTSKWWYNRIHPVDRKRVSEKLDNHFQKRILNWTDEYQFRCADGRYKVVLDRGYLVIDEATGKPIRMLGAMQDITKQKEEEHRLKLLESVITNASDSVMITEAEPIDDPLGPKILYVNEAFTRMTGYSKEEVIGQTPRLLQGEETDKKQLEKLKKSLKAWKPCEIEVINYKKNGEKFWINISIAPVADSTGWFTHWISIERDITEKKKQEELIIYQSKLQAIITEVTNLLTANDDWITSLKNSFQLIGETVKVDRVYLFENSFDEKTNEEVTSQRIEWTSENAEPQINNPDLQNIPVSILHDFLIPIRKNKAFCEIVDQLNEGPVKTSLITQQIKSIIVFPLWNNNMLRGFIGFDDCNKERIWTEDEKFFLQTLTTNISNVLERKLKRQEIIRKNIELEKILNELRHQKFALDQHSIVAVTDVKGTIKYVNDQFCTISQYSKNELIENNHRILNSGYHPKSFFEDMYKTISKGQVWHGEIRNKAKDGSFYWVDTTIVPFMEPDSKKPKQYIAIRTDITEKKKQSIERELLISELSQNNRDLRQFSFITSHNLRAPLSNLVGLLDMLGEKKIEDPELNMLLKGFDKSTRMLNETVNDLVKILIIKENPSIEKVWIDLDKQWKKAATSLANISNSKDIIFNVDFSKAPDVFFNKVYLESILSNLLSNAMKYRSNDRKLIINVVTNHDGDSLYLSFEDNGLGIDLNLYKDRIFGLYQRFHFHAESKGIGLYLIRSQMEALGGEIQVESTVNVGTKFTLTFKKH
jgi:PAS domain S-box-containing protein